MRRLLLFLALPGLALGQGYAPSGARGRVVVVTPDGGPLSVGIDYAPRLDTNITNDTVPVAGPGGARLTVEALGPAGGPLWVTGPSGGAVISELGQQTANLITNPSCIYGVPQITTIGPTAVQLPSVAESHVEPTTKWALRNLSNGRRVCCMGLQPDGGVPDCTTKGYVSEFKGDTIIIDGEQSLNVYCRTETGDALVNVWEASCVQ